VGTSTTGRPQQAPLALLLSGLASSGFLCPKFSVADSVWKVRLFADVTLTTFSLIHIPSKESGCIFGTNSWTDIPLFNYNNPTPLFQCCE